MRHSTRGACALALGSAYPLPVAAAQCGCGSPECPTVELTEDNASDLGCEEALIGETLPDSDGDGIPDACDACACEANALDSDTGRYSECSPNLPPADNEAARIRCENGKVEGTRAHLSQWFLRPTAFVYTREFDAVSTRYTAGAHLVWVANLDAQACVQSTVGGSPTVEVVKEPNWFLRTGAFAAGSANLDLDVSLTVGGDVGIDYAPTAGAFSVGPTLHLMSEVFLDELPLYVGLGVRGGLIDVVSITPFVQTNVLSRGALSYGIWLNLDWGILEDLGVKLP